MAYRRIIRFEGDYAKNQHEIEHKIPTTQRIRFSANEEEERQDSTNVNVTKLKKLVDNVISGKTDNNIIGVFGMYYQEMIYQLITQIDDNIIYLGETNVEDDVYTKIAELLIQYSSELDNGNQSIGYYYYLKQIQFRLYNCIFNSVEGGYEDYLTRLSNMGQKQNRDKILMNEIMQIRKVVQMIYPGISPNFVICIEAQELRYEWLNMLSKLYSMNLIIIVSSPLDYGVASLVLEKALGIKGMDKFFATNYVDTENYNSQN